MLFARRLPLSRKLFLRSGKHGSCGIHFVEHNQLIFSRKRDKEAKQARLNIGQGFADHHAAHAIALARLDMLRILQPLIRAEHTHCAAEPISPIARAKYLPAQRTAEDNEVGGEVRIVHAVGVASWANT